MNVDTIRMDSKACIIFDVDGVLIDTRKSYTESIKRSVQYLVKYIDPAVENVQTLVSDELIFSFRKSGMFNNDIDTSYAFILSILCKPSKISDLPLFIENIASNATFEGIKSVEKYLQSCSEARLIKVKELLNYPGNIDNSILSRVFDEFFYGTTLFRKQHGRNARYYFGSPLIEDDELLVRDSTLKKLSKLFEKRLAIVSGRSRVATEYSMKSLVDYFDSNASIYLEDEKREMGKPNPSALIKSVKSFGISNAFYVGDSTEDLLMVQRARSASQLNIKLIGVCTSKASLNQISNLFNHNGKSVILKDVNEIPNILNKVEAQF